MEQEFGESITPLLQQLLKLILMKIYISLGKTWGGNKCINSRFTSASLHAEKYDDAYLVKLNSSGIREWGTYYGEVFFSR